MGGVAWAEAKPLAILDSNVVVYSMVMDYPSKTYHTKCLNLLERGLKGELDYIVSLNPVVVVEAFSALVRLLDRHQAEFRIGSLLRSKRIAYLSISREASQNSIQWAKEKVVPVNDAMVGANMVEMAGLVYTVDEDHFKKLEEYGVKFVNPIRS
nr:PIN domain-containing protein [Candidatus Njordarchaeum guaymaensis]